MFKFNNRKGFIAVSVIYSFFILFVVIMLLIIYSYISDRKLSNGIKSDIKNNLQINKPKDYICKRATVLHTEECTATSSYCYAKGYYPEGTKGTSTITYGNLKSKGSELEAGDAYDCDVNGDGVYDPETERFYYISDYYDTKSTESQQAMRFNSNIAVLIYYTNVSGGEPDNTAAAGYGGPSTGPSTLLEQLPTNDQWKNIQLQSNTRNILNEFGRNRAQSYTLPSDFSYEGYSARLLTSQELVKGCPNGTAGRSSWSYDGDKCFFLNENTSFASGTTVHKQFWLETFYDDMPRDVYYISNIGYVSSLRVSYSTYAGARPAIEIEYDKLEI